MNKQISSDGNGNMGADTSAVLVRSVYYAVIVGVGILLFLAVYLAR
jgi:hypothetical protein